MKKNEESFYSKLGASGLEKLARDYSVNSDISFVKKNIKSSERVLDLACGYGRVTIPLAKVGIDIVGIDLDEALIRAARKRSKNEKLNVRFDVGNMTNLPYKDDSFDKIFCLWNSFSNLLTKTDQIKALKEIKRVLRARGSALLILPNGDSLRLKSAVKNSTEGRVVTHIFYGDVEKQYIHDKISFKQLLRGTTFKKYEIRHINMHNRRRMLVQLYK